MNDMLEKGGGCGAEAARKGGVSGPGAPGGSRDPEEKNPSTKEPGQGSSAPGARPSPTKRARGSHPRRTGARGEAAENPTSSGHGRGKSRGPSDQSPGARTGGPEDHGRGKGRNNPVVQAPSTPHTHRGRGKGQKGRENRGRIGQGPRTREAPRASREDGPRRRGQGGGGHVLPYHAPG